MIYENADTMFDFILENELMSKHTGILKAFNITTVPVTRDSFFLTYFATYAKFPVIDLLVKMRFDRLIQDLLTSLCFSTNVIEIDQNVKCFNKLLNPESTKGSLALTIPKYIADDLNENKVPLEIYLAMADIYQLDPTLTKENYEKIKVSPVFKMLMGERIDIYKAPVLKIPHLMAYNYSLKEILNYFTKKIDNLYVSDKYEKVINLLTDYNEMCDLMNVKPDRFPNHLREVHDALAEAYREVQNQKQDEAIRTVADHYVEIASDLNEKETEYQISLPRSSRDLVMEGQSMHNCVGSYIQRIANKESVVFFIRKKEAPQESFVTAEYRSFTLAQACYRNNYRVHDEKILELAKKFCNKAKQLEFKGA